MTQLQEKLLDLMLEIDHVCRENDIEFYLAAGTALGAIRHRGFIPWDDDADVYMTAENWKKFYAVRDQLPEGRTLVSDEENYDAGYVLYRYVDLTSTKLYRYLCANPQDSGITIDILVLDPVPDTPEDIQTYITNLMEYCNILTFATTHTSRSPYPLRDKELYAKVKEVGRKQVLDELKPRTKLYDGTSGGVLIQRDPTIPHIFSERAFGKPKYVPFENTMLPVAENSFDQLVEAFDEGWMYIPEEVNREHHMKNVILDVSNNNPFQEYLKVVDRKAIADRYAEHQEKNNLLGEARKRNVQIKNQFAEMKVVLHYERAGFDSEALERLLDEGRFDELDEYFAEYHSIQSNSSMIGSAAVVNWLKTMRPYYIDLGDDFLYLYLRTIGRKNCFAAAVKILRGRRQKGALSEKLKKLDTLYQDIKRCAFLIEKERYEEAEALARELRRDYPENQQVLHVYFGAKYFLAKQQGQLDELYAQALDVKEYERDDSVLTGIRGHILWGKGKYRSAAVLFEKLIRESTHGLVLHSIKELFDAYLNEHGEMPREIRDMRLYDKVCYKLGYEIPDPSEEETQS